MLAFFVMHGVISHGVTLQAIDAWKSLLTKLTSVPFLFCHVCVSLDMHLQNFVLRKRLLTKLTFVCFLFGMSSDVDFQCILSEW